MAKSKFIHLDSLSFQEFDENSELIPLMTTEDELEINNESLPETLPILPLRNTVLFPGVVIPITAGRDKSIKLINDANKGNKVIGVVAQKDELIEDPSAKDIHATGTVARILKVLKMPDGNTTVIIQGKKRFKVAEVITEDPYMNATIREVPESRSVDNPKEFEAIIDSIKDLALQIIKESPNIPSEASFAIKNIESNSFDLVFSGRISPQPDPWSVNITKPSQVLARRRELCKSRATDWKSQALLDLSQSLQNDWFEAWGDRVNSRFVSALGGESNESN